MTVKELIEELKQYPQDAGVAVVTDWENVDDQGNLQTTPITGLSEQIYVDLQFGDEEEIEIIMLV